MRGRPSRWLAFAAALAGGRLLADSASAPASALPPDTVLRPSATPGGVSGRPEGGGIGGAGTAALVALVGAAGGWMFWRRLRVSAPAARGEQRLAIAETKSLGNRQYLVVAAYGSRRYLIGVCPGRIDLLSPLEGDAAAPPPAS